CALGRGPQPSRLLLELVMATRVSAADAETPQIVPAWSIDAARALYNIEGWGAGFFDVNEAGHVIVRPDRERPERVLDLFEIARDLEEQGVTLPVLLRFSDILRSRIEQLSRRFEEARQEFGYTGAKIGRAHV